MEGVQGVGSRHVAPVLGGQGEQAGIQMQLCVNRYALLVGESPGPQPLPPPSSESTQGSPS